MTVNLNYIFDTFVHLPSLGVLMLFDTSESQHGRYNNSLTTLSCGANLAVFLQVLIHINQSTSDEVPPRPLPAPRPWRETTDNLHIKD